MIFVTKPYLPPKEKYLSYIDQIYERRWLTNNGPLVVQLEERLKKYLGVKHLFFTSNGTVALQIALKCLTTERREIITTPFSYVATTNSIIWEGFDPVFVDINYKDFCIDANKIEAAITKNTVAIMATHVYGNPCNVEAIKAIAIKYNLKVIYDGAHAFGSTYKGQSLLSCGDISTCSFHATKLFHTVEGGCVITNDDAMADKIYLMRQFGHEGDTYLSVGINGKNSEFHAAMGLCNLDYITHIIELRKAVCDIYDQTLAGSLQKPVGLNDTNYNYAYYPVIFSSEEELLRVMQKLQEKSIYPRRYFYPSLNNLPYLELPTCCLVSEDISKRVLCLPLYPDLLKAEVELIGEIINKEISG